MFKEITQGSTIGMCSLLGTGTKVSVTYLNFLAKSCVVRMVEFNEDSFPWEKISLIFVSFGIHMVFIDVGGE